MNVASKQEVVTKTAGKDERSLATVPGVNPFDEMERLLERIMPRGWLRPFRWEWPMTGDLAGRMELRMPAADVIDEDGTLLVHVELPGVDKADIDVTTSENTLIVKAKARGESKVERGEYFLCEISQGASARTIHLPCSVDPEQVKATLKNGILEVSLVKTNGMRRHQVSIE